MEHNVNTCGGDEKCRGQDGCGGGIEGERGRGAVAYMHVGHASHIPSGDVLIEGCRTVEHGLVAAHEKEDGAYRGDTCEGDTACGGEDGCEDQGREGES